MYVKSQKFPLPQILKQEENHTDYLNVSQADYHLSTVFTSKTAINSIATYFLDLAMKETFCPRERGNSTIEVGLICALIAVACITSTASIGERSNSALSAAGSALVVDRDLTGKYDTNIYLSNGGNNGDIILYPPK